MYRFGKAKRLLNEFSAAKKHLLQAKRLKPGWDEITDELEALVKSEEKWAARERFMYQRMFNISDTSPGAGSSSSNTPANRCVERPRRTAASQEEAFKKKRKA